jgi:ribonuclease Z
VFLSHGHLDHALGVPYVLSQRTRHQGKPTRVFCPEAVVAPLEALITAAGRLEETVYDYSLAGLAPGDRVEVGRDLAVEAFATDHVVPSLGYHLLATRRRLRPELRGKPGPEIARLRADGVEVTHAEEERLLSYCGDTGAGVFELEPRLFTSQVLMIECTFLSEGKRGNAAEYKHLHFDDLVAVAGRFRNRAIVLHHLSRRHAPEELRRAVDERLPELAERIHVLGAAVSRPVEEPR